LSMNCDNVRQSGHDPDAVLFVFRAGALVIVPSLRCGSLLAG